METVKSYPIESIRNIALVGHSHSGKTALADAIFYDEGVTTRLGRTQDRTSLFDVESEEIHRGGSITSHFGWVEHDGNKVNLIDTPGDQNFFLDGLTSMQGADAAIIVIGASEGVQLQTRRAWKTACDKGLVRTVFLNKMDRMEEDWKQCTSAIENALDTKLTPVQIPLESGESFNGVIDLFSQKALVWKDNGCGKPEVTEVPNHLKADVEEAYNKLVDMVVSTDDALLEKYLESESLEDGELRAAFLAAVRSNKIIPLLFGSAGKNIGVQPLLDLAAEAFPNPMQRREVSCQTKNGENVLAKAGSKDPFLAQVIHSYFDDHAGQVSVIRVFSGELPKDGMVVNASNGESMRLGSTFQLRGHDRIKNEKVTCGDIISAVKLKNTHTNNTLCSPIEVRLIPMMKYPKPMISYVLVPATKNDSDKLKAAVERVIEEDPSLSTSIDEFSHHMVLSGMGHAHIENAIERMKRKFHVNVSTELPHVAYRETFAKEVKHVEGKHKKQSGGAGQFGVCVVDIQPMARGLGFEFINEIYGGAIPRQYIPSVEKGIVERAKRGITAGYPVVDFQVTLTDGKHHPVDSKDIAFQMAGSKAFKLAMEKAGTTLLEPYYRMEIIVPTENAGDIMGDINSRRGRVDGMDAQGESTVIHATCPQAEVLRYVPDLRSMTGGRGTFTMEFESYKEVPGHLTAAIREKSPFLKNDSE